MIDDRLVEQQTKLYAYDLMNEAKEHGFKESEEWTLSMVTDEERIQIQKEFSPAVAARFYPEALIEVFQQIKRELNQTLNQEEESLTVPVITRNQLRHLIAYNPKRQR